MTREIVDRLDIWRVQLDAAHARGCDRCDVAIYQEAAEYGAEPTKFAAIRFNPSDNAADVLHILDK